MKLHTPATLATALIVTATAALGAAGPGARAADLETLRERAQRIGDDVTTLEHRLQDLHTEESKLTRQIDSLAGDIAALEVARHDADRTYRDAMNAFVVDAVEVYKSGSTVSNLDLLLSARTVHDLEMFIEVGDHATDGARVALARARAAREEAERMQQSLDERKQRLLRARARIAGVADDIAGTLTARRAALEDLTTEIQRLERQARRAAAQAARPDDAFLDLLSPSGPSAGIPDGFVPTGVSFEGVASWYGPGFEGNTTASGDVFDSSLFTAASKELPFGTWLYVSHGGRGVVVIVNDRGPYIDGRVLDLSRAAAAAIGITGIGWVRAEILFKK